METRTQIPETQIIATLGPASSTYEFIRALHAAGAGFFRLNFSHGTHETHRQKVGLIRRLQRETGRSIGIIADLQGPKLRIGDFREDRIALQEGMQIRFDLDPAPGDETRVSFPHPDILAALEPPAHFLMDDGNVAMAVVEKGDGYVVAEVLSGASLSSRKGVNVPDLACHVSSLTDKDRADLAFALGLGVDWIAQSFVQTRADVAEAKKMIGGRAGVIAKIEKPAAIKNFSDILAEADAVMVARGDLGVELPFEQVPALQKLLTGAARQAGKPVIIATQMLNSMCTHSRPTRAEATDVAQAVLDGASAVMLSGETAAGNYPTESVAAMRRICREMETGNIYSLSLQTPQTPPAALAPRRAPSLRRKFSGPSPK